MTFNTAETHSNCKIFLRILFHNPHCKLSKHHSWYLVDSYNPIHMFHYQDNSVDRCTLTSNVIHSQFQTMSCSNLKRKKLFKYNKWEIYLICGIVCGKMITHNLFSLQQLLLDNLSTHIYSSTTSYLWEKTLHHTQDILQLLCHLVKLVCWGGRAYLITYLY